MPVGILEVLEFFADKIIGDRPRFLTVSARIAASALLETVVCPLLFLLFCYLLFCHADKGTPILNGIHALVKTAEAVVKLNRIMGGGFLSKRLYYAPPTPDQIDEIRKYYGDVYPSVPGSRSARASAKRRRKPSGH